MSCIKKLRVSQRSVFPLLAAVLYTSSPTRGSLRIAVCPPHPRVPSGTRTHRDARPHSPTSEGVTGARVVVWTLKHALLHRGLCVSFDGAQRDAGAKVAVVRDKGKYERHARSSSRSLSLTRHKKKSSGEVLGRTFRGFTTDALELATHDVGRNSIRSTYMFASPVRRDETLSIVV